MLTFKNFSGINNVLPGHRLPDDAQAVALNVDIGLTGEIKRRQGYSEVLATCHKNIWQAKGFMLATVDGGDLIAIAPNGTRTFLYFSLGASRVWYCNLPDGRTTWSNGLISGITNGVISQPWGVPIPASLGAVAATSGALFAGDYRYQLTYTRQSGGLESGASLSGGITLEANSGLSLSGLPTLAGHSINVYLSGHNGEGAFYAGSTASSTFSFAGANDALVLPLRTDQLQPAPIGTLAAFWRGRVLTAVGPVLYASKTNGWESFDIRRDFKQFSAPITLIQPVEGGIFVGTTKELVFLAGSEFDKLALNLVVDGAVVLGSGVSVQGESVQRGQGTGQGPAMVCIAARGLVAGFSDGGVSRMTEGRYATSVSEVAATFRHVNGIPQYIAIPL